MHQKFNLLKPTVRVMHQQFNIQQLYVLPTLYLCVFVFIWEQTATCAIYSTNWLVFITEMKSVYCAVRTGSLNKSLHFVFKVLIPKWILYCCQRHIYIDNTRELNCRVSTITTVTRTRRIFYVTCTLLILCNVETWWYIN